MIVAARRGGNWLASSAARWPPGTQSGAFPLRPPPSAFRPFVVQWGLTLEKTTMARHARATR